MHSTAIYITAMICWTILAITLLNKLGNKGDKK